MPDNHSRPSLRITREEIKLTVQLHVMSFYRQYFLREELNEMLEGMPLDSLGTNGGNSDSSIGHPVYDRVQVGESINTKLQSHRQQIQRMACYIDNILYNSAGTTEEYSNLDDLESRTNEIFVPLCLSFNGREH